MTVKQSQKSLFQRLPFKSTGQLLVANGLC